MGSERKQWATHRWAPLLKVAFWERVVGWELPVDLLYFELAPHLGWTSQ